ncbi:unnamed protein product [Paramecium sonneborni]|uniref:Uncharacterized protein n=1 Tax=Paramecium sonneborni TaxID=65129 RepID=A0A8S1RSR2_9CILI|nr:unnamed protein product [Paramecium sonneborni]
MDIRCTQANHRNQQIIGCCIDSLCSNQRPYCNSCLPSHGQHINKIKSLELLDEWILQRVHEAQNVQKNVQECQLSLNSLLNLFIPYYNFNIQQFSQIGLSQIDNIIKGLCQLEICEEILFKQLKQSIEQIKYIIDKIFKKKKDQKTKCNQQIQNSEKKQFVFEQSEHKSRIQANQKNFTLDFINHNSIKQGDVCKAIAFNKDQTIVLAGCNKDIKVFEHQQGKLKQIQLLSEHKNNIYTLNFMENTNDFLSGSQDKSIIIWQVSGNNQWSCQQILNGHSSSIFCLLLNNTDDLIISGSQDKTIKFWIKQKQWLCQQTMTDHSSHIYSLSLNQQQNKLISCSNDSQILVIEQSNLDKQWSVTQKIKVDQFGCRLCIIDDHSFTFQPYCKEQMYVYELDSNTKQYRKSKEITVQCDQSGCDCFFPQQYLKEKCLLVNKNGRHVNLIRRKENGDFIIQQSIEFANYQIYGRLSGDGQYLITWDNQSKEIQLKKFKNL